MIDEKKLIESLLKKKRRMIPASDGSYPIGIDVIIDYIADFPKLNKWISVEDRLPEDDEESEYYDSVNVTLDNGKVTCGCYRNAEEEWWVDSCEGHPFALNMTGHVIAWRPLPEPYNPDGKKVK